MHLSAPIIRAATPPQYTGSTIPRIKDLLREPVDGSSKETVLAHFVWVEKVDPRGSASSTLVRDQNESWKGKQYHLGVHSEAEIKQSEDEEGTTF